MPRLAFLLCIFLLALPVKADEMRGMPSVTVLAASSLTNVMTELAATYTRQTGVAVSMAFDASSILATQITEGEPADIFITAHPKWMTELKQKGLVDIFSITNLASNRLVLAASKRISLDLRRLKGKDISEILASVSERAIPVIADPAEVPLGIYTQEALEKLNLWKKINQKVIRTGSARATLYLIAKGETLGIIYYSDAMSNPEVEILAELPQELHEPITYQAAVVAGENMAHARDFLKFLKSKQARKVFAKYQFVLQK